MSRRLAMLRRVVRVQEDLQRAAEWRLAALENRQAGLARSQDDLNRFLGEEHAFSGLFAASMANRMRSLATESAEVAQGRDQQAATVFREASRAKRAGRMMAALEKEERSRDEARDLLEAVERAGRSDASQR